MHSPGPDPVRYFSRMISNCLRHAKAAKGAGRPIVGIMCEYAPRELIMAADAVPVCLCGGAPSTIPAAEEHLPANLCPLIKSTFGYHVQKANHFLEMADLVVAETTCDGKKKMYELMAESRPMHVMELPQKAEENEATGRWYEELVRLKTVLETRFSRPIDDDAIRRAIRVMNRERRLRRELAALMASDAPPFTGRQLLEFKSSISGIPDDLEQYERALELFRGQRGEGTAGRVRVLLTGVPTAHGAERVVDILEQSGGLVVASENCTGLKPILEDVDEEGDPLGALAAKYVHLPCSVMTPNDRRIESIRGLSKEYGVECVVELVWQACLTYDVESNRVRRTAERELGLPYLRIETDYSTSDSARIAVRCEALFETVRAGRPAGASGAGQDP